MKRASAFATGRCTTVTLFHCLTVAGGRGPTGSRWWTAPPALSWSSAPRHHAGSWPRQQVRQRVGSVCSHGCHKSCKLCPEQSARFRLGPGHGLGSS
eukprot:1185900-Prorocentrum_minimum.AAC.3